MGNTQTPSYFADSASSRTGVIDAPQEVAPNTDIELAKHYIKLGWSLIPLKPSSKKPDRPWKQHQTERADTQTVLTWLSEGLGLGVVLGEVSDNWVCRDFDDEASYRAWGASHPDLRDTLPTSQTGRGFHVFAKITKKCKHQKFADGELRSDRNYVAIPPSKHPSATHAYKWIRKPSDGNEPIDVKETGFDRSWSVPETTDITEIPETTETTEIPETTELPEEHRMDSAVSVSLVQVDRLSLAQDGKLTTAIRETVPYKVGGRNDGIWRFARKVVSILGGQPTLRLAEELGYRWYEIAKPKIGTLDPVVTLAEFCRALENVKLPDDGESLVDAAFRRSKELPTPWFVEAVAARDKNASSVVLAKLVVAMDEKAGGGVWYLSSHHAGRLIGTEHTPALRILGHWVRTGVLKITEKGVPGHPGSKAHRYQLVQRSRP